jgi:hypothetical protein
MLSGTLSSAHVAAVHHPVRDLEEATLYFAVSLGFTVRETAETFRVVENGALVVRLARAAADGHLELEVAAPELATAEELFAGRPELRAEGGREPAGTRRLERRFRGPHGLVLVLCHWLGEDELPAPLPLPSELPWHPEAAGLTQEVLRAVPEAFRDAARRRVVHHAEAATLAKGAIEVPLTQAVASLRAVTPDFQRPRLDAELTAALARRQAP